MSVSEVEVVMDGPMPKRVIVTSAEGVPVELPSVFDVKLEMKAKDVTVLTVKMYVTPSVRPILEEER